jgi:uncharacterized membrane protein (UPF0127 family)
MEIGTPQSPLIVENLTRQRVLATRVRAARDSTERRCGLLFEQTPDQNTGLWIDPCEAVHTFRMRFNLDVLFLDGSLRVKKIVAALKPNRIALCLTATSVLELNAGAAAASGTECGDQLVLHRAVEPYRAL